MKKAVLRKILLIESSVLYWPDNLKGVVIKTRRIGDLSLNEAISKNHAKRRGAHDLQLID